MGWLPPRVRPPRVVPALLSGATTSSLYPSGEIRQDQRREYHRKPDQTDTTCRVRAWFEPNGQDAVVTPPGETEQHVRHNEMHEASDHAHGSSATQQCGYRRHQPQLGLPTNMSVTPRNLVADFRQPIRSAWCPSLEWSESTGRNSVSRSEPQHVSVEPQAQRRSYSSFFISTTRPVTPVPMCGENSCSNARTRS